MRKLNNIIVGFTSTSSEPKLIQTLSEKKLISWRTFSKSQAKKEFTRATDLLGRLKRYIQRNIGGGPAEFLQDIQKMKSSDRLVMIETADLEDATSDELVLRLLENGVGKIKRFGDYSVEHVTHEGSHSAEVPAFDEDTGGAKQDWTPTSVRNASL